MLARYAWAEMVRNPRRSLSTTIGVTLGVGLFCAVLFFIDGLSASMTQRAIAPLPLDMQRVLGASRGGEFALTQTVSPTGTSQGSHVLVELILHNRSEVPAHDVVVRSVVASEATYVVGSTTRDGVPIPDEGDNPLAHGDSQAGLNIGTLPAGGTTRLGYRVAGTRQGSMVPRSTLSSREASTPVAANTPPAMSLVALAARLRQIDGVRAARGLTIAALESGALMAGGVGAEGPVRVFGLDRAYAEQDPEIVLIDGRFAADGAVLNAAAAQALGVGMGDTIGLALPDGTVLDVPLSGIVDLAGSRALFGSRRGEDLEAFVYVPNAVILDPAMVERDILPAYDRAAAAGDGRLKNPPIQEVDLRLDRDLLDADPATALAQTQVVAAAVAAVAPGQDVLLDNISNTLEVATGDAALAKRLFAFLGVPGGLLAAILAAYAGAVLAGAQRRERATLRIRGARRGDLLALVALRTALVTGVGSSVGVVLGYGAASLALGPQALAGARLTSLVTSGLLGLVGGLAATGLALYLAGHRSVDREIQQDRARLTADVPLWRRARVDLVGGTAVGIGTILALATSGFDGTHGSVYVGRGVELALPLLLLPMGAWVVGSLVVGRMMARTLSRTGRGGRVIRRPLPDLIRQGVSRRPFALADAAVVVALVVALGVSLTTFTVSYDQAKAQDARFITGSDIRVTPRLPDAPPGGGIDAASLEVAGVGRATGVVYGVHNTVLRSRRTSDVANLAAVDPLGYLDVAPLHDDLFGNGTALSAMQGLADDPGTILLAADMAGFLRADLGDLVTVLLGRATEDQVSLDMEVTGIFDRLPGFPDGADALLSMAAYTDRVPDVRTTFYLADTINPDIGSLSGAASAIQRGPGRNGTLDVRTREQALGIDQSSLAALNIRGLIGLDTAFGLAMGSVAMAMFCFGLLLQRRREFVTLRALGLGPGAVRTLIGAEAGMVAVGAGLGGTIVGVVMAAFLVAVLRPLFIIPPTLAITAAAATTAASAVAVSAILTSLLASRMVNRLPLMELLRED